VVVFKHIYDVMVECDMLFALTMRHDLAL